MIKDKESLKIFELLSRYINLCPDFIEKKMIDDITRGSKELTEYAYGVLLAAACGLDCYGSKYDMELYKKFFPKAVKRLDSKDFSSDPYYKNIKFPKCDDGDWSFCILRYKPYEAFVRDDPVCEFSGRVIPQIAFFEEEFPYPAVLENGREWMTVTPNEIVTMKKPIEAARGKVLTYGLGLGYYAYMVTSKDEVDSLVVVERDESVIKLFKKHILPQFPHPEKVRIVQDDAFKYAENEMANGGFDVVFTDIWHDPSDGAELYLKMKALEHLSPKSKFYYWIEDSIKLYI